MTYVITSPCIDTMDQSCVDVCPVDCIHFEEGADKILYIDPDECYLLACTHLPCNDCLKMIASYGIRKVIYKEVYEKDPSSIDLSKEFNIELIQENV